MSEPLNQVRNQLNDYFQKFDKKQKTIMVVATVFAVIAITGLIFYFTRPEYVELYRNLEPQQTGSIMDTLDSNNIKAKIGHNSGSILVLKKDEKRAQVVVATQGLPSPRFSFEDAFAGNSFMMTSEERSKRNIYALQNYLSSIIEEMEGIRKADVTLAVPERTGFVLKGNEHLAKASVKLSTQNNAILDSKSINGIAILVSNAVEGLTPENVTIHGNDGRVLNENSQTNPDSFDSNNNMSLQQSVKDELERSITNFLSSVYGYGNVVVMANVKLDFDSEVTEIKEFAPPIEDETNGIPRSMQKLRQNVVNEGIGGMPGTPTNTEDDIEQYVEGDEEGSTYYEASDTINYEINELYKKIVKAQGQIKDITVAVFLNSTSLAEGDLTDEEKNELKGIISAAAGLDTRVVQVGVQQFNDAFASTDDFGQLETIPSIPLWIKILIGVLIALVITLLVTNIRKKRKESEEAIVEGPIEEMVIPEPIEELNIELAGSQVKQQIEKLVNKKPEAVAQLLKNWLNED